ncbi:MAG: ABC transporter permease [Candidatus Eisenbacteria bacterium]
MRARDLARYALRALRGHRLRSFLSLLGVAIGVGSVVLLTSLGEGARLYVTGEFASLGSNLLILLPGKTETQGGAPVVNTAPHDLTLEDVGALERQMPEIVRAAPLVVGSAAASVGDRSRDIMVLGTTDDMREVRKLSVRIGRYFPPGTRDAPFAVLGAKVQQELFGHRNPLGEKVRIGDTNFRVIGVLAPRGTSIGMDVDETVHIPIETGMRLLNARSLFRVLIELRSAPAIEPARERAIEILKQRHDGEEDFTTLTQDAVLSTFQKILGMLTAALAGIAAISLSVAGIGIMNVMLVSVSERTREIGLLKAVGVGSRQIVAVFLLEASILSTAGGILGLAIGILGGRIFQGFFPDFPARPPVWAVVAALAVSTSVGLAFGILPARRAARLDPIQALMRRRG